MIALDFDDVIADSASILRMVLKRDFDFDLYSLKEYKINIPNIKEYISKFILNFSGIIPPAEGAIIALELLEKYNIPIIFITARKKETNLITSKWIKEKIGIDNFSIINRGLPEEKITYLKYAGINFFVEDRLLTAKLAAELDSIKKVYLINKNWNMGREFENEKIVRINSVDEAARDYLINNIFCFSKILI